MVNQENNAKYEDLNWKGKRTAHGRRLDSLSFDRVLALVSRLETWK